MGRGQKDVFRKHRPRTQSHETWERPNRITAVIKPLTFREESVHRGSRHDTNPQERRTHHFCHSWNNTQKDQCLTTVSTLTMCMTTLTFLCLAISPLSLFELLVTHQSDPWGWEEFSSDKWSSNYVLPMELTLTQENYFIFAHDLGKGLDPSGSLSSCPTAVSTIVRKAWLPPEPCPNALVLKKAHDFLQLFSEERHFSVPVKRCSFSF